MDFVKNGILYRGGVPAVGMGVGYYASFHPDKYPVPPEGDRAGEMRKDLAAIAGMGFNMVRTSALGDINRDENGNVVCDVAFPDEMAREAQRRGLSLMMRLNGYSMNMTANPAEVVQRDCNGKPLPPYRAFITDCMNHPSVIRDCRDGTKALASHFAQFESVVLHLLFNEPAYSPDSFYDYHPETVRAFREWVVSSGKMTAAEAAVCDPPVRRPVFGEPEQPWIDWRLFLTESLNRYLGNAGRWAREGNPRAEGMTCMTPAVLSTDGVCDGSDLFDMAREMDIVGVTDYLPCFGASFWFAQMYHDVLASAAQLYGKHVWAAECNARATLTPQEWERETYTLLGSGMKGIFYYQWRADYNNGRGPEIGAFGILHSDGQPTEKVPVIAPMNRLVQRLGTVLASAEKRFMPVGILFSKHANAFFDARENGGPKAPRQVALQSAAEGFDPGSYVFNMGFDRNVIYMQDIHRELRSAGIAPSFVRAGDLLENRLGVKVLVVPSSLGLSDEEKTQILAFAESGGLVFEYQPEARLHGYTLLPACKCKKNIHRQYHQPILGHPCTAEDMLTLADIRRGWRIVCPQQTLGLDLLSGPGTDVAAVTNFDSFERPAENAVLVLDADAYPSLRRACMMTPRGDTELAVTKADGKVCIALPPVDTGCFIVLEK